MTPLRIRDVAGRVAGARVVELAECGHSPYFEDPGSWNEVVDEFLTAAGAP